NAGSFDREREGVRPADRSEQPYADDAPHGEPAAGDDSDREKRDDGERKDHERSTGEGFADLEQEPAKDEQRQVKLCRAPAAERDDNNAGSDGNSAEQKLFRARRQLAQFDRAHEPTDQHAKPEKRDIAARL